jgi:hypothetical protein
LIEVFEANIAVVHALDQMVTNGGGEPGPGLDLHSVNPDSSTQALFPKHEAAQLVSQLFDLFGIAGGAEAFCQLEERFLYFAGRAWREPILYALVWPSP